MDSAQFEALWQSAQTQPVSAPAETTRVHVDVSLGSMLDQYLALVATNRDAGKVSQDDYNALAAAISDVKAVLTRINDGDLVAEAMALRKTSVQQLRGEASAG